MNMHSSDDSIPSARKRRYKAPAIVDVGSIGALTTGHSEPVGDPPQDGTTGYYNAAGANARYAEVDLEDTTG
jgi:hypothetical protein